MMRRDPVMQPARDGHEVAAEGGPEGMDPMGMVTTLIALGVDRSTALAQAGVALGRIELGGLLDALLAEGAPCCESILVLDAMAEADPEGANALLGRFLPDPRLVLADPGTGKCQIVLTDRLWVTSLPDQLTRVEGDLLLNGCANLTTLPPSLSVRGDIFLSYCEKLHRMPSVMEVGGRLWMPGCVSVMSLPDGLRVGDLGLDYCTGIVRLPNGLQVANSIRMLGCTAWDRQMPPDVRIQGWMHLPQWEGGRLIDYLRHTQVGRP